MVYNWNPNENVWCTTVIGILMQIPEISNDEEWSTYSESDCSDNSSQCDSECDRTEVNFPGRATPKAVHLK